MGSTTALSVFTLDGVCQYNSTEVSSLVGWDCSANDTDLCEWGKYCVETYQKKCEALSKENIPFIGILNSMQGFKFSFDSPFSFGFTEDGHKVPLEILISKGMVLSKEILKFFGMMAISLEDFRNCDSKEFEYFLEYVGFDGILDMTTKYPTPFCFNVETYSDVDSDITHQLDFSYNYDGIEKYDAKSYAINAEVVGGVLLINYIH